MNEKKLKKFKKMLLDKREELQNELRRRTEAERNRDEVGAMDTADQAESSYEIDFDLTRREALIQQIREVDEAIERMGEGAFGTCENCGEEIPEERLKVWPNARYCTRCKSEMEKRGIPS